MISPAIFWRQANCLYWLIYLSLFSSKNKRGNLQRERKKKKGESKEGKKERKEGSKGKGARQQREGILNSVF